MNRHIEDAVNERLALNAIKGDVVEVTPARALGMYDTTQTFYMRDLGDGNVRLTYDRNSTYGPIMPASSVRHFVNDLEGRVELPPSGIPAVDAVTEGRAELLGKGDDGVAFRVGREVVKVSTTVPYQPTNPGHLSPEAAADRMRQQTETHNHLVAVTGGACIDPAVFVQHGQGSDVKGFQIKPYVDSVPEGVRLSREQLDALQDCLITIHQAGYAINDQIQVGLGPDGRLRMFDVGKAAPLSTDERWRKDEIQTDINNLSYLYRQHGRTFVRRDLDEGEQRWQRAKEMVRQHIYKLDSGESLPPGTVKFLTRAIQNAAELRREIARATLEAPTQAETLAARLALIDEDEAWELTIMEPPP